MRLPTFARRLSRSFISAQRHTAHRARLYLEALEDRYVLSGGMQVIPYVPPSAAIVSGFDSNTLAANDDGSTGAVELGFTANFFGTNYTTLFVNNNGNVTFDSSLYNYTPFDLSSTRHVIIAPFFADVDTRVGNLVTYGTGTVDGHKAFGVSYPNVGYYFEHTDKLNAFQVLLIDRSDTGVGNFDIEFNYGRIQWETGDASEGRNGLGGFSARVGFSNGTGQAGTSFELPGSAVNGAFLDSNTETGLVHTSLNSSILGRFVFAVRSGVPQTHPPEPPPPSPPPPPHPAPTPTPTVARHTVDTPLGNAVANEEARRRQDVFPILFLLEKDKPGAALPAAQFAETPHIGGENDFALKLSAGQAQPLGEIRGRVFEDYDGNGLQSANEPGMAGQTVFLDLNGNGYMDDTEPRTLTDDKGDYRFMGLAPGVYKVRQVIWSHLEPTQPSSGERQVTLSAERSYVGDQNFGAVQRTVMIPPPALVPGADAGPATVGAPDSPGVLPPGDAPAQPKAPAAVPQKPPVGPGRKEARLDPETALDGRGNLCFGSLSAAAAFWWGFAASGRKEARKLLQGRQRRENVG